MKQTFWWWLLNTGAVVETGQVLAKLVFRNSQSLLRTFLQNFLGIQVSWDFAKVRQDLAKLLGYHLSFLDPIKVFQSHPKSFPPVPSEVLYNNNNKAENFARLTTNKPNLSADVCSSRINDIVHQEHHREHSC